MGRKGKNESVFNNYKKKAPAEDKYVMKPFSQLGSLVRILAGSIANNRRILAGA